MVAFPARFQQLAALPMALMLDIQLELWISKFHSQASKSRLMISILVEPQATARSTKFLFTTVRLKLAPVAVQVQERLMVATTLSLAVKATIQSLVKAAMTASTAAQAMT